MTRRNGLKRDFLAGEAYEMVECTKDDQLIRETEVSHRSTRQIVACAASLAGLETPKGGRAGIFSMDFMSDSDCALSALIEWLQGVTTAAPNALVGVILLLGIRSEGGILPARTYLRLTRSNWR